MKLFIQKYLAEHTLEELTEQYAIRVKRHSQYPNLVHFKYNQISSPLSEPIVQECRGIILDEDNDWKVVAFPYRKFFNYGEPNATKIDWSSARIYEKLDGTLIVMYYYDNKWQTSTTGTPDATAPVGDFKISFNNLFWRVFSELGYGLPKDEMKNFTFMFELLTPLNQIVVRHNKSRIVLHGVRDVSKYPYEEQLPDVIGNILKYECVKHYSFNTIEQVVQAAEKLDCFKTEGFVVVDKYFNRIKIKNSDYVLYHHLKSSFSVKKALEVIRKGESQEYITYFPELKNVFDVINKYYQKAVNEANQVLASVAGMNDMKSIALSIKNNPYKHFVFAVKRYGIKAPEEYFLNMHIKHLLELLNIPDNELTEYKPMEE